MWSLRTKPDGTFYLTFDRKRDYTNYHRMGLWERIGPQGGSITAHCVRVNEKAGYLCVNDDEGDVRVLVLKED